MIDFFQLMPHGYCLSWRPELIASYVLGNGLIAFSYFSIPFFIFRFVRQRPDIEFKKLHWLFAIFIFACGITHVLHVVELWWPVYYIESLAVIITALVSLLTAITVWKLLPDFLEFPSIAQLKALNEKLRVAEVERRTSEERLRGMADSIPDSYLYEYTVDTDGTPRFRHIGPGIERLNGLSSTEVIADATRLFKQIDPEQLPEYRMTEAQSRSTLTDFSMDLHMRLPNGEWRWVHAHSRPRTDADGTVVWDGLATDVTNRHLFQSEINRLAQAIEQNPTAVQIVNARGELEYVNSAYTRTTGYQFGELYDQPREALFSSEVSAAEFVQIEEQVRSGRPWRGVQANRHKDGELHWEEITASAVFDSFGRMTHYLYTRQDITEREKLLLEVDLASRVLSVSNEAVMVCDAHNHIISVNPAFSRITGYTEAEVLGHNPGMLASGRHDSRFYAELWQAINKHGEWSGEIWNRRKDGAVYPEWLSIATFTSKSGEILNYVAIFSDITSRKAVEEQVRRLAHYDPLTNLPNRTLLQDRVGSALASAQRHHGRLALMYLDLDRFKNVNDSLGHLAGDALLVEMATRLKALLREEDTVSRIGGDEFVIALPGADAHGAASVANKVLHAVAESVSYDGHDLSVGVSIGIALYPENGHSYESLTQAADAALYRAKQTGRNNYQFFTTQLHARAQNVLRIESALRRAVERNELFLYYQPQFDIGGSTIVGAEALLRWHNPELGWVSPGEFIPVAEECGLILEIGSFVLNQAVQQQARWLQAGIPVVPLAVNLSLAQFRQPTLPLEIATLLDEYGLPARLLELELTESMAMDDPAFVVQTVDKLSELGVTLSIDDFGTGYSSLSYLKRFRVHKLKIDQSFVRDLPHSSDSEAIINAIIGMAHSLKCKVIAEGVETSEQLHCLHQNGCDEAQGYHFSRPVPADDYVAQLNGRRLREEIQ
ncbi:MAG: EAL domain-containing protein [Proteobacteria bacterium]|nr:EAL domain-containing protein [Pseudomonadota bacterium]